MKSLRNGAPEFPPPPKIWLMTICGDESGEGSGLGVGDGLGVGVGDGVGGGVGVGVGALPPMLTDTELL